jgi:hypothetical protein
MPVVKSYSVLEFGRKVRLFLHVEGGLTGARVEVDQLKHNFETKAAQMRSAVMTPRIKRGVQALRVKLARRVQGIEPTQQRRTGGNQILDEQRAKPAESDNKADPGGIKPENIIWILGSGRTGSTWLGRMMGDLEDHALWHEPYVGEVFGTAYYIRAWDQQRERKEYILSRHYKHVWLKSIRTLVLDGAKARYPEAEGYLVIKEPHGSIAAPLLMEAFPESRMIFLVRDPRDVVSSLLDAHRKGSWTRRLTGRTEETLADKNPDAFVQSAAKRYLRDVEKVKQAYDAFDGHKVVVKYEALRTDTVEELRRIYRKLDIPVSAELLQRVVDKHDWDNIPDKRKGAGKSHRKASPGSWSEDLTPEQAASIEQITVPILDEFYAS